MKKLIIPILFAIALVGALSFVSAEFWACASQGQVINYCNDYKEPRTCASPNGCQYCMSVYDEENNCYIHGVWSKCNQLPQECSVVDGEGEIDVDPPELTINSPVQDGVYQERSVLLDLDVNERATIYYTDLNGRGRWTPVCNDCTSYSRERRFDEGLNELRFRATDVIGNEAFFDVSFRLDSQDPRIRSTEPTRGFIGSSFTAEIDEENPTSLTLHYGNDITGFRTEILDLETDCEEDDRRPERKICSIDAPLSDYDGQDIEYWFIIEDIAGNMDESDHPVLTVDETLPVINNPDSFFEIDGRFVYFNIDITELNFEEVGYMDLNDDRPRERRLCSRLDEGVCEERISLRDGLHDLSVYVLDQAGHKTAISTGEILIDSRDPRISRTEPRRGYANGVFSVEFREDFPEELILHYGNEIDMRSHVINIEAQCVLDRRGYECSAEVDLTDYDGEEIEYWFELTDVVGNIDMSSPNELDVDTTLPIINELTHEIDGRRVRFTLDVTEENFDQAIYIYEDRGRIRDRRLCSRLDDEGICDGRASFSEGHHDVTVQVFDEAGNMVEELISFDIV